METNHTFRAGICMAGAVSAGAYTAGVMDYLIQALENWEKAKKLQSEGKLQGIPKHNFLIEVLGGASAGGMTAAITAAGLQQNFNPVKQAVLNNEAITRQNPLYNAWVNLKEDNNGRDMMDVLLNTDDIEKGVLNPLKEVRAGFNSEFIKEIATDMLSVRIDEKYDRPYLADKTEIFTTLTNLRGFAYNVQFKTATGHREHRMRMHRDYAFFRIDENANDKYLTTDGRIPIHFNKPNGLNTEILKQAAMSTGAFPIGLESRELVRGRQYIEKSKYLNLLKNDKVSYEFLPEGDFLSLNVDGGVINNEPYEITEELLNDRREARLRTAPDTRIPEIRRDASGFENLVLMIDPFPDDEGPEAAFTARKAWKHVVPSILSAMRSQLMMKDEQIKRAYLDEDYTRFLIMPQRTDNNHVDQKYAIACGSLGGFGGFFSKEFRKHDYFLGRRNCQRFLQRHFSVPADAKNPILEYGYQGVLDFGRVSLRVKNDSGQDNPKEFLCLIPDIRVDGNEVSGYTISKPEVEKKYPYPSIKLSYILGLKGKITRRIKSVMDNIQNAETPVTAKENDIINRLNKKSWLGKLTNNFIKKPLTKLYIGIGKSAAKGEVANFFIESIIRDMDQRGLLEDDLK